MCDINRIWLFNLLVAFVLIIQQQQHVVVAIKEQQQQQIQPSPYDNIASYATVLASKYLHQHSLPKVNVVKREIKNDKNTDFISYLSDFNMQDETSIPEDIFDQRHLNEIEEIEEKSGNVASVGLTTVDDAVAATVGADVIDVNLPYDDSDADVEPEADIILESQRSSERNFTTNDDGGNKNIGNLRDEDSYGDEDGKEDVMVDRVVELIPDAQTGYEMENFKKTNNNKTEIFKENQQKINYNSQSNAKINEGYQQGQLQQEAQNKEIKYENNIESSQQFLYAPAKQDFPKDTKLDDNYEDAIDDDDDDDDGSAEYERFKKMHEQKQKEKEQQQQQQQKDYQELLRKQQEDLQQQQKDQQQRQHKEHLLSIKKLNERKFNKPSLTEHVKLETLDKDDHENEYVNDNNDDDNKAIINNNDHDHDDSRQQQVESEKPAAKPSSLKQDAIGDIAETLDEVNEKQNGMNENSNIWKIKSSENKDLTNLFIPRKMKRHNGAARLDDATNRYTRIKQQQQQQQQQQEQSRHQIYHNSHEDNLKVRNDDDDNNDDNDDGPVDNQEEYMSHIPHAKATKFQKSYYGIVNENASHSAGAAAVGIGQSHTSNSKDNSNISHHSHEQNTNEQQGSFNNKAATTRATSAQEENKRQSLFEKEKSLRRNNRHYGHKTHKKKYKDYLRYSSILMMRQSSSTTEPTEAMSTAATTPAAVVATLESKTATTLTTPTKLIKLNGIKAADDNLRFSKERLNKKLKMDKLKGIAIPASPIFVVKSKDSKEQGTKPFYEGQINYYLETDDDGEAGGRGSEARFITKGDRMDTNDWYRKLSPVLRNGVKTSANNNNQDERASSDNGDSLVTGSGNSSGNGSGGYTPYHHYRSHHQRNHHHNHHQKHQHHHNHQHHASRNHAYQRKMIPKKLLMTTTPMPPPSRKHSDDSAIRELGHQITDLKEFERYYAKWPHLARVQSQLHDEQLREQLELQNLQKQQMGNYQDYEYDEDYFEALQANAEENLPPYIRKYNRRNKQLLDLLEGTLPPATRPPQQLRWSGSKLQPGPRDSSVGSMSVRIDDDYLKEKRKRYHQRQKQIHDLFEQQKENRATTVQPPYAYVNSRKDKSDNAKNNNNQEDKDNEGELENHLPDEDVSISMETQEHNTNEQQIWQKEIGSKSSSTASSTSSLSPLSSSKSGNSPIHWQMEKLITPSVTGAANGNAGHPANLAQGPHAVVTPKPAVFKLPSYPSIAGSFIQRPRSRSAQFAPSSGSEHRRVTTGLYSSPGHSSFINAGGFVAYNGAAQNSIHAGSNAKSMSARFSSNDMQTTIAPYVLATPNTSKNTNNHGSAGSSSSTTSSSSPSSSSSASVSNSFVYHRVIDASPRLVGAGPTGRKQRLPFVAITDRRLETSKKSLTDHQKDFEQNHYPLP